MNNNIINTLVFGCNSKIDDFILLDNKCKIELKKCFSVHYSIGARSRCLGIASTNHSMEMTRIVSGERCATANHSSTPEQTAVP